MASGGVDLVRKTKLFDSFVSFHIEERVLDVPLSAAGISPELPGVLENVRMVSPLPSQ